jgi:hypothetical protein
VKNAVLQAPVTSIHDTYALVLWRMLLGLPFTDVMGMGHLCCIFLFVVSPWVEGQCCLLSRARKADLQCRPFMLWPGGTAVPGMCDSPRHAACSPCMPNCSELVVGADPAVRLMSTINMLVRVLSGPLKGQSRLQMLS